MYEGEVGEVVLAVWGEDEELVYESVAVEREGAPGLQRGDLRVAPVLQRHYHLTRGHPVLCYMDTIDLTFSRFYRRSSFNQYSMLS